jgi:Tfp pilus assembly protein PilF
VTQEDIEKGVAYFNQAIEKDPNYALADSGLADSYTTLGMNLTLNVDLKFAHLHSDPRFTDVLRRVGLPHG